jgi:predicted RNase H-like HicB family nuclease
MQVLPSGLQISQEKTMRVKVVLEPSDEGGYTVYVPSLPGCISEGETVEEALENIQEAIELYLEPVEDELIPPLGRDGGSAGDRSVSRIPSLPYHQVVRALQRDGWTVASARESYSAAEARGERGTEDHCAGASPGQTLYTRTHPEASAAGCRRVPKLL